MKSLTNINCYPEIICSKWSHRLLHLACSGTRDEVTMTIQKNLTTKEKGSCKSRCQNLRMQGCCFISDSTGCYFKPGAYATSSTHYHFSITSRNDYMALSCYPKGTFPLIIHKGPNSELDSYTLNKPPFD